MILLTDGGADPSGIAELVQKLHDENNITLTTVGVGRDAAPFLPSLAEAGGGRYHFAADPGSIPSIFTEETTLASRSYIEEGEFFPKQVSSSPLLNGITEAPSLYGLTWQHLLRMPRKLFWCLIKTIRSSRRGNMGWAKRWRCTSGFRHRPLGARLDQLGEVPAILGADRALHDWRSECFGVERQCPINRAITAKVIVDARDCEWQLVSMVYTLNGNIVNPDGSAPTDRVAAESRRAVTKDRSSRAIRARM